MKVFFLSFLLIYLSLFPSASPQPVVEIYEEIEHLVQEKKSVPELILIPEISLFTGYSDIHCLSPQFDPHPELRPPELFIS